MTKPLPNNRGICDGDRARSGVGETPDTPAYIQSKMSDWTDEFLEKFINISKSEPWKKEAVKMLSARKGTSLQLLALSTRRAQLRRKKRALPRCSSR